MLTDQVSDYLTRIRNALGADLPEVEIPPRKRTSERDPFQRNSL